MRHCVASHHLDAHRPTHFALRSFTADGLRFSPPEMLDWMVQRFEKNPLFERRGPVEHAADPVTWFVQNMTDEAQRIDKSDRQRQNASLRRLTNPPFETLS